MAAAGLLSCYTETERTSRSPLSLSLTDMEMSLSIETMAPLFTFIKPSAPSNLKLIELFLNKVV